jgi:hypothetical protein
MRAIPATKNTTTRQIRDRSARSAGSFEGGVGISAGKS